MTSVPSPAVPSPEPPRTPASSTARTPRPGRTRHLRPILPGATLGVLGGGQLGRMFAIAARQMGYRVATYAPEDDTPTGQVSDIEVHAPFEDLDRVAAFARQVDVVTFEFENVPVAAAEAAGRHAPVRPDGTVLHIAQHRRREKEFLRRAGIPVAPFACIETADDYRDALQSVGTPAILKTAGFGYDGKGQARVDEPAAIASAHAAIGGGSAVLERRIDFRMELSVIGSRGAGGRIACFPPFGNTHVDHILDLTISPLALDTALLQESIDITRSILETLDVVGVLCVEFFLDANGTLLVNEIAPRPHNSGHLTIDASITSQFEQQIRAICGLPPGDPRLLCPAAMVNLLGDLWFPEGADTPTEPNWAAALDQNGVKLHLYGKRDARKGRKMGHLTAFGASPDEAERSVRAARAALSTPVRSR